MATKTTTAKVFNGVLLVLISLGLALSAGCGGGGGGGVPPGTGEVPVVLGQAGPGDAGGHFPFTVGNQWQYQVTSTETGQPTQNFVNTVTITETRVVGGQTVTVFQESNPDGSGIAEEIFLVKDANGIAGFGNSDPADTVTPLLVPFWEVRFPLETGASFVALDRKGVDFGEDLDGDAINEKFDLHVIVTTVGFESVTVPAGTFANSARIRRDITLSIILSSNGTRVPATDISTGWFAPGVGEVRSEEEFQMTFQGVTSTETTVEELTTSSVTEPPPPGTFVVANDSFAWLGNSRIAVPAVFGVLANDVGVATITAVQTPSAQGGTVSITDLTGGGFTYEPPVGFIGIDTFTYTAQSQDGSTATGTVTITVSQMARYVMNNFTGTPNGSSTAPFTTLAAATAASGPGNIIFVYAGDGTNAGQNVGIDLLSNQRLLGQAVGLTFDVLPNDPNNALLPISGVVSTTATPGALPVISDDRPVPQVADNQPIVGLASGVEVAGIRINGAASQANLDAMQGTGIVGFNIHDNAIENIPAAGVLLAGASGGVGNISNNTFTNLTGVNPDNAIDIITTAANVQLTVSGNTMTTVTETGLRVRFDAGGGTVFVTGNQMPSVGTGVGRRGIDVEATGTSIVTSTISGNLVGSAASGQINRSGIQVNADISGQHFASVMNNVVRNTGADGSRGIEVQNVAATSSICLQMTGNDSDNGFTLDNLGLPATTFQIEGIDAAGLAAANNGIAFTLLNPGDFTFVAAGTCGFAP